MIPSRFLVRTALAQLSTRSRISASSVDLWLLILMRISLIEFDASIGGHATQPNDLLSLSCAPSSLCELRNPKFKIRNSDWPGLKSVGGDIQPLSVTVLPPATYCRWRPVYPESTYVNARKLVSWLMKPGGGPYIAEDSRLTIPAHARLMIHSLLAAYLTSDLRYLLSASLPFPLRSCEIRNPKSEIHRYSHP